MSRDYSRPAPPRRPRPRDLFWTAMAAEATEREQRLLEQRRVAARRPGRLPLPRRRGQGASTSARRARSASASRATSPTRSRAAPSRWSTLVDDIEFLLLVQRGRGAARREPASSSSTSRASTSGCATTSATRTSRSRWTRTSRASTSRASAIAANRLYFGPYSSAKRTRATLDMLGKVFLFRSCQGTEPGRRSGSPCLDYYIKRCGAPCVGYVTREQYMRGDRRRRRVPVRAATARSSATSSGA